MSLTRREFLRGLGGVLAAGVAPAFIGANVLMPVKKIWTPDYVRITGTTTIILWGDGVHDDTAALQAFFEGRPVVHPNGAPVGRQLFGGEYRLNAPIRIESNPSTSGIQAADLRLLMPDARARGYLGRIEIAPLSQGH